MSKEKLEKADTISAVKRWLQNIVIELNLCPFAKRELDNNRVRFAFTEALDEEQLLTTLKKELERLTSDLSIETTLLIHPTVLQDFYDYNQFLNIADSLLVEMKLEGVFQIASFHPDYQFADTEINDAENYSNRSPYPVLHILREESLEHAIAGYPDVDKIPQRNIEQMSSLGTEKLQALLRACTRT